MFTLKYRLQEEALEGGEGGGGEAPKTYTQEELDAALKGLKDSRDALLTEKKTVAQKAREAEAEALRVSQEAAKKAGELDKFEASLRGEFEKEKGGLTSKLEALTSRVTSAEKKAILGSMQGDFITPESVDLVSQLVQVTIDGDEVKKQFLDFGGNVITTDPAEFKKWLAKHPAISHLMKADAASGGGAAGNKSSKTAGGAPVSNNQVINNWAQGLEKRLKGN